MRFAIEKEPDSEDSFLLILNRPLNQAELIAFNALCEDDASADYYAHGENADNRLRIACEGFKLNALSIWLNSIA
jgi:hypothetical protein